METVTEQNKISFSMPLTNKAFKTVIKKSEKTGKDTKLIYIKGIGSNGSLDYQGEQIQPIGMDISYLLSDGIVDYEHDQDIQLGVVLKEGTYVDEDGLHIHAALFADEPYTQKMMKLYDNLQLVNDATGEDKHLSFSIEGITKARDPENPNIITDILIYAVALTAQPANTGCRLEEVEKSLIEHNKSVAKKSVGMTTGYADTPDTQVDGAALRRQQLEGSVRNLREARDIEDKDKRKSLFKTAFDKINTDDDFSDDDAVILMQVLTGKSRNEVENVIKPKGDK